MKKQILEWRRCAAAIRDLERFMRRGNPRYIGVGVDGRIWIWNEAYKYVSADTLPDAIEAIQKNQWRSTR